MASHFCVSCRHDQRSGDARLPRRASRARSMRDAALQAMSLRASHTARTSARRPLDPARSHVVTLRPGSKAASLAASGSLSRSLRQTEPLPNGNSPRHQSPPEDTCANPATEVCPSMPASFTSTDSESEITLSGYPSMIHNGRKTL